MSVQIAEASWRWPAVASLSTRSATSFWAPVNLASEDVEAVPHALSVSAAAMTRGRRMGEECSSALAGLRRARLQAQRPALRPVAPAALDLEADNLPDRVRSGEPDLEHGALAEGVLEQPRHARRAVGLQRDRAALERAALAPAALAADLERGAGRRVGHAQPVQPRAGLRAGPVVGNGREDLARPVAARAVVVDAVAGDLAAARPDGRVRVVAVGGRGEPVAVAVDGGRRRRRRGLARLCRRRGRSGTVDADAPDARVVRSAEVIEDGRDRLTEAETVVDRLVHRVALGHGVLADVLACGVDRDH